jgi:hypothetical protein
MARNYFNCNTTVFLSVLYTMNRYVTDIQYLKKKIQMVLSVCVSVCSWWIDMWQTYIQTKTIDEFPQGRKLINKQHKKIYRFFLSNLRWSLSHKWIRRNILIKIIAKMSAWIYFERFYQKNQKNRSWTTRLQ